MMDKKGPQVPGKPEEKAMAAEPLADLKDVKIDKALPLIERVSAYMEQIKNPYHFTCHGVEVHVVFKAGGEPFQRAFINHLSNMGDY